MPRRIKDYLIILSAGLYFSTTVLAEHQTSPERFTLLSRAEAVQLDTHFDKAQRQWLQNKRELVLALHAEGAFKGKSASNYVANVLGMGRATVYKHLKELKG
mgnify:CR=1 FL=1